MFEHVFVRMLWFEGQIEARVRASFASHAEMIGSDWIGSINGLCEQTLQKCEFGFISIDSIVYGSWLDIGWFVHSNGVDWLCRGVNWSAWVLLWTAMEIQYMNITIVYQKIWSLKMKPKLKEELRLYKLYKKNCAKILY